jgi:hypothetical protein
MNTYSNVSPSSAPRSLVIPPELVPDRAGTVAFLGNQTRQGDWLLPRLFRVVSMFASVTIDLTRARVGPGTSDIEVRSVFGNVEIIVPHELRVECDGTGILGNFEANAKAQPSLSSDAPLIRITGTAFLANVEVTVVDPNAPGWFAKLAARLKK